MRPSAPAFLPGLLIGALSLCACTHGRIILGTNVPAASFVAAIQAHQPQLVGPSALLTTTMPAVAETVRARRSEAMCQVTGEEGVASGERTMRAKLG